MHGVQLKRSTAYHPQTDGQSEVVNRDLETYLRCFCSKKPRCWLKWLAWAELYYNTSHHSTTNCTPFKAMYGRDPPPFIRYEGQQTNMDAVDKLLEDRDAVLDDLRINLIRAQQKMAAQANKHRRDVEFKEGDKVFLKLRPYRQQSTTSRKFEKLAPRFYGPFTICQKIGKVAYKLELPPTASIHPVFHVSQLRTAHGTTTTNTELPRQLNAELELIMQPLLLRGVRPRKSKEPGREVLIQWKGFT